MKTIRFNQYRITSAYPLHRRNAQVLASLFEAVQGPAQAPLGGRGAVATAGIQGIGPVVVKQYRRGGILSRLVTASYARWGKTRGQEEFELLKKVRSLGVNAPEPVAFATEGILVYRGWLATREISGARTLAQIAREEPEKAISLMGEVTKQLRVLIKNRIHHVDFHPGNVLIDGTGKVFLIDFDKGRYCKRGLKKAYLSRWQRAVRKYSLPKSLIHAMESDLACIPCPARATANFIAGSSNERVELKHKIPENPSILIILMGSLGDLVRGLSLVGHIKEELPGSRITWLVEPAWEKIAAENKGIDRLIVFNRPLGVLGVPALFRELSRERFHITLDLQRHFKSGFFSLLSGAQRRIGFHRRNAKEFNWLFNNETIGFREETFPKIDHYLMFTQYLGLPRPARLDFGFSDMDEKQIFPSLAGIEKPFIALVMGSSWESKDWTFEGYQGLAEEILAQGRYGVVLLGDRSKAAEGEKLSRMVGSSDLLNLAGKTTLMELIAVLKAASACAGPDSGPAHLAGAVGTPYVSLFGPTCHKRVAPYGSEDLVVRVEMPCAPCYKKKCANRSCMSSIEVSAVMEKLDKALEG